MNEQKKSLCNSTMMVEWSSKLTLKTDNNKICLPCKETKFVFELCELKSIYLMQAYSFAAKKQQSHLMHIFLF